MLFRNHAKKIALVVFVQFIFILVFAQPGVPVTKWTSDGNAYYLVEKGEIVKTELPSQKKSVFISKKQLITKTGDTILPLSFQLSKNEKMALIYTKAKKEDCLLNKGEKTTRPGNGYG